MGAIRTVFARSSSDRMGFLPHSEAAEACRLISISGTVLVGADSVIEGLYLQSLLSVKGAVDCANRG